MNNSKSRNNSINSSPPWSDLNYLPKHRSLVSATCKSSKQIDKSGARLVKASRARPIESASRSERKERNHSCSSSLSRRNQLPFYSSRTRDWVRCRTRFYDCVAAAVVQHNRQWNSSSARAALKRDVKPGKQQRDRIIKRAGGSSAWRKERKEKRRCIMEWVGGWGIDWRNELLRAGESEADSRMHWRG